MNLRELLSGISLKDPRIAAGLLLGAVLLGLLISSTISLVSGLPQRAQAEENLEMVQGALEQIQQVQTQGPEALRTRVAAAEATLSAAVKILPSDEQGMEEINRLYQYAAESGVRINTLEEVPARPGEKGKTAFTVRRFSLEAMGDLQRLGAFLSLLTESAPTTLILDHLTITSMETTLRLNVELILYTSPFSPGVTPRPRPSIQVTPQVTPGVPTQPEMSLQEWQKELYTAWDEGDWGKAVLILLSIRQRFPSQEGLDEMLYQTYVNYGYALLIQGRQEEAMAQFTNALNIKPDGAEALDGIQRILQSKTPGAFAPGASTQAG